jgi:lipoprotein-releasing system ATP-binding protein
MHGLTLVPPLARRNQNPMTDTLPILEMKNVTKSYRSPEGIVGKVLADLTLTLEAGSSTAIVGPSGSGKSTLLNIAGTLDKPDSGAVIVDTLDVLSLPDSGLADLRARKIGFVFQAHHLLPQCTALENVMIPSLATEANTDADQRARVLLDQVGLSNRLSYRPGQLSGGECQRIAVARALMNKPKILLADEPTGSLDDSSSKTLAQLLLDLNRNERTTLLIVTHSTEIASLMDRQLTLQDGTLKL